MLHNEKSEFQDQIKKYVFAFKTIFILKCFIPKAVVYFKVTRIFLFEMKNPEIGTSFLFLSTFNMT